MFMKDSLGDLVVKNRPANASDLGSISGSGRPHMPQGSQAHALHLLSLCSVTTEATAMGSPHTATREQPHLLQQEKASVQQRRPSAAKNKRINVRASLGTHW